MSLTANSQGVINGQFTVPANVPAGTKLVQFQGPGGVPRGSARFTGQGQKVTRNFRIQATGYNGIDPIAQTFTLREATQIAAVDLWFVAKGTASILVQIRETQNGFPTQSIVGERRLNPADITTLTSHTTVAFDAPVPLLANTEYAVVVLCDDAVTALAVAELGKYDPNAQTWVTAQPYQVGVLLSSSNASTWTAHQDRDLTFRLHRAVFTQTNKTVALGTVAVTGATDLMLLTADDLPSSVSRIEYELTLPDASKVMVSDGQPVRLAAPITGDVSVSAKMFGDASSAPVLFPGTQLVVGAIGTAGTYISRAIPGGSSVRVKVLFDAVIPGGSTVAVHYKGIDAGDTWTLVPFVSSAATDGGFYEIVHEISGVNEAMIQIRLSLTGSANARPRVRNLRFMTI